VIDKAWFDDGAGAAAARAALWPASLAFAVVSRARNALFDAGVLATIQPAIPCVSVGNLTVGGTGKTPFAAWLAARLGERVRPAIVLRGYGSDELEVHRHLNPDVPVFANPDRLAGAAAARVQGARLVVLDDAFQHRRVARVADIVLVSVEQVLRPRRLLPAGPWREPLGAARRAGLVVLTRKSASDTEVQAARAELAAHAPEVPVACVHLAPARLAQLKSGEARTLDALAGAKVIAVSGIGEPETFQRQLEQLGARVTVASFRDHHAYTRDDILRLAAAEPTDATLVCTLKDAVKLSASWPGPRALWYLSQHLVVEQGAEHLDKLCALVVQRAGSTTAG